MQSSFPRLLLGLAPVFALATLGAGCSSDPSSEHESDEPVGVTSDALSGTDPVSAAVAQSCTTAVARGLATQLVAEIQCMRPDTLAPIDKIPGLSLGSAVFPYLQKPAASALVAAQKARGTTMTINSALRALPQQYLLYRWYQTGRCGISLAASPGTSNHESALAVDIEDNAGWRSAMTAQSFRWLGASDPVHYDFIGGGAVDLRGLSVKAFQRLWNRNNPADLLAEDGSYGPATEARLAKSPLGGFAKGALCGKPDAGAVEASAPKDSGTWTAPTPEPTLPPYAPDPVPDAPEPAAVEPDAPAAGPMVVAATSSGCSTGGASSGAGGLLGVALGVVALIGRRRRRSRTATT